MTGKIIVQMVLIYQEDQRQNYLLTKKIVVISKLPFVVLKIMTDHNFMYLEVKVATITLKIKGY